MSGLQAKLAAACRSPFMAERTARPSTWSLEADERTTRTNLLPAGKQLALFVANDKTGAFEQKNLSSGKLDLPP